MDLAADLRSLLTLERVDKDLFRGRNANYGPRRTLFGGQVAAQCLLAAAATVEAGPAAALLPRLLPPRGTERHPRDPGGRS